MWGLLKNVCDFLLFFTVSGFVLFIFAVARHLFSDAKRGGGRAWDAEYGVACIRAATLSDLIQVQDSLGSIFS